jgi:cell division protein FtsQ
MSPATRHTRPRHDSAASAGWSNVSRFPAYRLAGRRGPSRATRRRVTVTVLACMVASGVPAWLFLLSPVLTVRAVTVPGVRQVSATEVTRVAQVPMGVPLTRVDTEAVGRRVAALGPVASVRVRRGWPNTIRIEIRERRLTALLPVPGGYATIDGTGMRYGTLATAPAGTPLIGMDPHRADPRMLQAAAMVLQAFPKPVASEVQTLIMSEPGNFALTLRGDITVIWGGTGDSDRKAVVLSALMKHKAKVYDVSAPNAPVLRS